MTEKTHTTLLGHSLIWFGAAVSIAEIITGTLFAPLGFFKALLAIVAGHALGCVLLYCSGVIGARSRRSAMESAKLTFGERGGRIFAGLNVLQLVGWTAVMISAGARAADGILPIACGFWLWAAAMGALIIIWQFLKFGILEKANLTAMVLLFVLSVILSKLVCGTAGAGAPEGSLSFGEALELSMAMPVSWLPLIGDYTRDSSRPRIASLISAGVYFMVSCWMYVIGLCAVLCLGETDVAAIMRNAGLGTAALAVVILSTVTTTCLDVFSAGVSAASVAPRIGQRPAAAAVCLLGTVLAVVCDATSYENFLYWIGSVFVPMAAIQIMDEIVLKKRHQALHNLLLWLGGFAVYRVFLHLNLPCGSMIPDILLTALLCLLADRAGRSSANAVN